MKAGVSQEGIAEELCCDPRTIQRYEAGEQSPTKAALEKMHLCYDCGILDLFGEDC